MLSQLGCVTLDPALIQDAYAGTLLSATDPQVAKDLLSNIPRMEPIAWMVGQQLSREITDHPSNLTAQADRTIVFGAKILKLAVTFDRLRMQGLSREDAIAALWARQSEFAQELIDALTGMKSEGARMELRTIHTAKLTTGMILQQEIRSHTGMLIVTKG